MATVKTMPASGPEAGLGARLQLIELTKVYGDVVAADRVTLDIAPGEFITLLGPSGIWEDNDAHDGRWIRHSHVRPDPRQR
jgi:hypothetical protein